MSTNQWQYRHKFFPSNRWYRSIFTYHFTMGFEIFFSTFLRWIFGSNLALIGIAKAFGDHLLRSDRTNLGSLFPTLDTVIALCTVNEKDMSWFFHSLRSAFSFHIFLSNKQPKEVFISSVAAAQALWGSLMSERTWHTLTYRGESFNFIRPARQVRFMRIWRAFILRPKGSGYPLRFPCGHSPYIFSGRKSL